MTNNPLIYIVDDNDAQAEATSELLSYAGFDTKICQSGEQFLAIQDCPENACVLLDNHMPGGISGLEVQAELADQGCAIPIVFMSGDSEFRHVVKAMKSGAHEFLQKPFKSAELIASINSALTEYQAQLQSRKGRAQKLEKLTPREKEVLDLLTLGYTNKMISKELSIVISTVEFHRANLMRKLEAQSLSDLIAINRE